MKNKAITKMQAIVIAIIIVVAAIAGVAYYYSTLGPAATPTPATPTPKTPTPATPTPATPTPATPTPPPKDKIRIGYVDAFTGIFAPGPEVWGTFWMEMLIDEYNKNGGLYVPEYGKKLPIQLIKYDSKSDTETLVRLTEKCMTEDKVDLMFAPWGTSQNFAVLPTYDKYGYPLIAHAMGSGQVVDLVTTGGTKWVFPVLCQPPFGAKYSADLIQWANASRIGIIGISDLHGIEWTGQLVAELSRRGISPAVGPELYPLTVTDLSPLIRKLKEANVDALWASTYPADGTLLIRQSMELGYCPRIMFMGPGSQYPAIMLPAFGVKAMTGIMEYHGFEVDYKKTPKLLELAEKYKAKVGYYPGPNTVAAYVCHEVLFKAVEKYGLNRVKIRDAFWAGETFDTVVGPAKFDMKNVYLDAPGAGYLCQWQGEEILKVVWPLDRATAKWIPKTSW
jgi:branched-chain amino acid transport system substrate-binding protein